MFILVPYPYQLESMSSFEFISMPILKNVVDSESKNPPLVLDTSSIDVFVDLDLSRENKGGGGKPKVIDLTSRVDEYPDGGLVAWLVVVGVCPSIIVP